MSHPCSATAWHNNGMHGAPAAAKAVVGCADHSLTMVRPAAVMSHSMRPRYKITAVLEEYIMHAGSFSRFRYMLLRFELTAAVSSNRSSDYCCCYYHRPCEPVPGKVCGKDAADTTGFENRERSVSRLIHCMYLRVNFGGIRRLIPVVFVWLFGGMHEIKIFAPIIRSFAPQRPVFNFCLLLIAGNVSVRSFKASPRRASSVSWRRRPARPANSPPAL